MQKIIQIEAATAGQLFALTEDGKVYQGFYKGPTVTWIEMVHVPQKVREPAKPVGETAKTPNEGTDPDVGLKQAQNQHQNQKGNKR